MRKLFICERPYILYKSIVKAMLNTDDEIDIVLSNHMAGVEKMEGALKESGLFKKVFFYDDKLYQDYIRDEHLSDYVKFPKILISWPKKMKRYYSFHQKARKASLPSGLELEKYDEIYAIDGVSTLNLILNFRGIRYIVSEHARNNFQINMPLHKLAVRISIILDRLNIIVAYSGCSKYVSAIEVSENKNLVSYLKGKKIIEYNIDQMTDKLAAEDKNRIFELYASAYNMPLQVKGITNVLLTAPLLEDGLVESKEKAEACWRKLVNEYSDEGCTLLIKAHPRDKTDYKVLFPESIIVNPLLTAEVLAFGTNLHIHKAINLYSSAVAAFSNVCECITVGLEYVNTLDMIPSENLGGGYKRIISKQ